MGIRRWLTLVVLLVWGTPGVACSLGYQGMEVDLQEALRNSEDAFVAKLSDYERERPYGGGQYFLGKVSYTLVETIKGQPSVQGELVERTPYPAVEGVPPGPACGPWVATEHNDGATFLMFASRNQATGRLLPHPFSLRLDVQGTDPDKWLNFIRTTQRNQPTP
jgi:hypothetical protein